MLFFDNMIARRVTSIVIMLCISNLSLMAQLNIKAGFVSLYTPAPELNGIITAFNLQEENRLQNPMPDLHFLNGILVGAKYSFDYVGLDLTWENTLRKRIGNGEDPNTNNLFQKEYFFNMNALTLSLESTIKDRVGIALGIGRRHMRIRRNIGTSPVKLDIFDDKQQIYFLSGRINLILTPYSRTPLVISPFVQYPLEQINLFDFEKDLDIIEPQSPQDRFLAIGISISYYYGRNVYR